MESHEIDIDDRFIIHLREEKLRQQDRRAAYVNSKFTFVIGLFGFVATLKNFGASVELRWINGILYLIPITAVLFDRYILGGEFAVKRIRTFLIEQDKLCRAERRWNQFLDDFPKGFMDKNRFLVTFCVFIATGIMSALNLLDMKTEKLDWIIFFNWTLLVLLLNIHLFVIEKMIKKAFKKNKSISSRIKY